MSSYLFPLPQGWKHSTPNLLGRNPTMPSHWVCRLSSPPLWEYILRSLRNQMPTGYLAAISSSPNPFPHLTKSSILIPLIIPVWLLLPPPGKKKKRKKPISCNPGMFWVWGSLMFPTFLLTHYRPWQQIEVTDVGEPWPLDISFGFHPARMNEQSESRVGHANCICTALFALRALCILY